MRKKRENHKYRKIWIKHNGPIPLDEEGRTYDIHHRDGNRKNDDPSNLECISLQHHYDIHYAQGDYSACILLANRMKMDPKRISELSSLARKKEVENGTHHWLGSKNGKLYGRENNRELVENGKHHFQHQKICICPHCGVEGANGIMKRWHFDNCQKIKGDTHD